jgi:hypothetical protein
MVSSSKNRNGVNTEVSDSHGDECEDGCYLSCCDELHHPDDEAASTSEMSVNFYQTTWRNNPEDSHLQS